MPDIQVLADPTPAPESVPVCRYHGPLVEEIHGLREDIGGVRAILDQLVSRLVPQPIDATLSGRVVGVAAHLLDDAVVRRALALAVLAASLAGGGYGAAEAVSRLVLEPAYSSADAAAADGVLPPIVP